MKVSIASYAFHGLTAEGMMDIFGYLESCKFRYRLDVADIWNGTLGGVQEDHLHKVRRAMDEREMTLVNMCIDRAHLWDPDPAERERLHQNALAHLRAAEILGAKTVRIDMGGRASEMTEEQFDHIVTRYREHARRAGDGGYMVGPENHFGPATSIENMERVYRAVDHPAFGVLLHVGHWEDIGEAEGDRRCAPLTMHTHVDARITETCLEERVRILLDSGYEGYWGVEHHSAKNEFQEVAWQMAEVQRMLVRLRG